LSLPHPTHLTNALAATTDANHESSEMPTMKAVVIVGLLLFLAGTALAQTLLPIGNLGGSGGGGGSGGSGNYDTDDAGTNYDTDDAGAHFNAN
jgi:hypothetical protein